MAKLPLQKHVLEDALQELVEDHVARYPEMEAVDLYKLLHQRFMGPGHAMAVPEGAREALMEDARAATRQRVEDGQHELDPVEMLDETRGLARVYLVPYLRAGGDLERLHRAFVETAARITPDLEGLKHGLSAVSDLIEREALDVAFDLTAWRRTFGSASRTSFPAMSHSQAYREAYLPAYRLVLLECLGS